MKVTCISGDFSKSSNEIVKAILLVGDEHLLPKEGQQYEVIGYANIDGVEAYEFSEIDTLAHGYDKKLVFCKNWFVISDDTFVPNAVLNDFGGTLCRKVNFYIDIPIDINLEGDYEYKT